MKNFSDRFTSTVLLCLALPLVACGRGEIQIIDPSNGMPPSGFAYLANQFSDDISVYTIDSTTGALTVGTPVVAGKMPVAITIDPTGCLLYTSPSPRD